MCFGSLSVLFGLGRSVKGTALSSRSEFLAGAKAELPILLGVLPFGMIYGVLAIGAGLPASVSQAMSSIVFAGSAQFMAAQLFRVGTPGVVIVLTVFVVNLRHMLYSASVAPHIRHLSWKWKALLAYLLTDEAYAVAITHYTQSQTTQVPQRDLDCPAGCPAPPAVEPPRHWHFLGAGLALWLTWQVSTAIGIVLGAQIPAGLALDFALALTFIALVVPALKDRPSVAAACTAGVIAVAAAGWPYKLGLMAAALSGIVVGVLLETRQAGAAQPAEESAS
jgi:predicted branched-subunit amino acid permease